MSVPAGSPPGRGNGGDFMAMDTNSYQNMVAAVGTADDLMANFFAPPWAIADYHYRQRNLPTPESRIRYQPAAAWQQAAGSYPLHPTHGINGAPPPPIPWPPYPPPPRSQQAVNEAAAIDEWSHIHLPRREEVKHDVQDNAEGKDGKGGTGTGAAAAKKPVVPARPTSPPVIPPRTSIDSAISPPRPVPNVAARPPSASAGGTPLLSRAGSSALETKDPVSSPVKRGPTLPAGVSIASLAQGASVVKTESKSLVAGKAASSRALGRRTPQERVADALDGDWAPQLELLSIMVDDLYQDSDSQVHCCVALRQAAWPSTGINVVPVRQLKVLVILKYLLFNGPESFFVHYNNHFKDVQGRFHTLGVDKKGQAATPEQIKDAVQLGLALRTFSISPLDEQAKLRRESQNDRLNHLSTSTSLVFFDWRHSPFADPKEPNFVVELPDGVDEAKLRHAAADFPIRFQKIPTPHDTTVIHQSYQSGLAVFAVQAQGAMYDGVITPYGSKGFALLCVSTSSYTAWRLPLELRPQSAAIHPLLAIGIQRYEQQIGGATTAAVVGRPHPYNTCAYPLVAYDYAGGIACYNLAERKVIRSAAAPLVSGGALAVAQPTTVKAGVTAVVADTKVWIRWLNGYQLAMVTPTSSVWYWNADSGDKPKLRQEGKIALASDLANTFFTTDQKDTVCIVGGVTKSDGASSMATVRAAAAGTQRMVTRYHYLTQGTN
jgi:hypothetical protein